MADEATTGCLRIVYARNGASQAFEYRGIVKAQLAEQLNGHLSLWRWEGNPKRAVPLDVVTAFWVEREGTPEETVEPVEIPNLPK